MTPPALELADVRMRYGDGTLALEDVGLTVAPGEFVAVVGPSGSGKSTLLRLASRLVPPSGGTVRVAARGIGYVFQDATLLPWRRVRGNVELLGELDGVPRRERRERAGRAIELVGLGTHARHLPHALSGGMRMRASLARALTRDPDLFLFDEPFGALDDITRRQLAVDLMALFTRRRFAALFVTHSVSEAVYLAGRVVVLSPGPGRVLADVPVPFAYPRSSELRYTSEFTRLTAEVADVLGTRRAPAAGAPAAGPPAPEGEAAEPVPAARRGRAARRLLGRWGPALAVLALVLAAWYAISELVLSPERRFLLPPPHAVVRVGFLDPANLAELLGGLWLTTQVAAVGLAIAAAAGVTLAVAMSQARWVERSLYPYAVVLQTVPILAMVPLIGFWFGFGLGSRVLVCVLIALFPIVANTLFGLRSVQQGHRDLFDLHHTGRMRRLVKLELPAALPAILTGVRISAGLSVTGAIVGDFFFRQGQPGLGILIDLYRARLASEQLFAAVILGSLLGLAAFALFGLLARRTVGAWHESYRGEPAASDRDVPR
jgi:NitT/TauT family transport system permease protein